jgi:hypothetical protein
METLGHPGVTAVLGRSPLSVAPGVLVAIATGTDETYVPAPGLNVGVATCYGC